MRDRRNLSSGEHSKYFISRYELAWAMALAGTGLGAGVLYLPFAIGTGGFLPIVFLTLFCVPLVFFSHRNLSRVCLSPAIPDADMHSTIKHVFPKRYSSLFIAICFLSVFPTLLIYAIGITNITNSFINHQLQLHAPSNSVVSVILIVCLVIVIAGGERWLLRVASAMVTPLTIIMSCLAVYLIPYWQWDLLIYIPSGERFWSVILLGLPVMTFSFYHAPMCAVMARAYREHDGSFEDHSRSIHTIHCLSTALLFIVILFFVVSCLLCLSREELLAAQHSNLPILSVLANTLDYSWFSLSAPVIAFLSIATSFFGFFLGTVELINGILSGVMNRVLKTQSVTPSSVRRVSILLAATGCWIAAISNWNILEVIAGLVAPMMAIVVFFIPLYAIYRLPEFEAIRNKAQDIYVLAGGLIVVTGFVVSLFV